MSTNHEEWGVRMTQTVSNVKQYAISLMEMSIDLNFKHIYEIGKLLRNYKTVTIICSDEI